MDLELVVVGAELLLGFTPDRNGAHLGRRLAELGVTVIRRTTVPDRVEAIQDAVREALARTRAVLVSGGLGPTDDDVTRPAVAALLGRPLRFDQRVWDDIVARVPQPATIPRSQAEIPEGAEVLPNRWGIAPGLWIEAADGLVILLPGVPSELDELLEHTVAPRLRARAGPVVIRSRVVRTTSLPESVVAERTRPLASELAPLTLAFLPGPLGVDLRLTAWRLPEFEADAALQHGVERLRAALGEHVYGEDEDDLAAVLLSVLRARGLHLALAESCTGGLLGARVTAIPGSSEVFLGGVVCYADRSKTALVGVSSDLLAARGAVSREVALAMARGAADRFGAEVALGVTGVAGPTGGTAEKPVGLVCFGWLVPGRAETDAVVFPGARHEVRERAAQYGLFRLLRLVAV
jgi:nicotinamide-nucleotide amidase